MCATERPTRAVLEDRAWVGAEVQPASDWCWRTSTAERDELLTALDRVQRSGLALHELSMATFLLPTFSARLASYAREVRDGRGFVLLRGFPTDGLDDAAVRTLFLGTMTYFGLPVAQNARGDLLDSVRDEGHAYEDAVRAYQTSMELGFHSDSSDLVALFCIKPAKSGGASRIVSAVEVHNTILRERPDLLEVLYREPLYFSWKGEGPPDQPPYYWGRAFSWYQGHLRTRWSYGLARATQVDLPEVPRFTDQQAEALAFVDEVSRRPELALDMDFQPGDVQVLSNDAAWHGRTAFEDHDDPDERRHLLRVWMNHYVPVPTAPDFENRYDLLGETTRRPHRRVFPVPVHDAWA